MVAYLIATETVHDEATFAKYREQIVATLPPFGGKFIARGGNLTVLEGEWPHPRLVVIEFPSRQAVQDWYGSDAYKKIIDLRRKSTTGNLVISDGVV